MDNTALGAKNTKKQEIVFISEAHEKFYYEKLKEVRYQDVGVSQSLGIKDGIRIRKLVKEIEEGEEC